MSNTRRVDSQIESWRERCSREKGERKCERQREEKIKGQLEGPNRAIHLDLASEFLVMGNASTCGLQPAYLLFGI
jgi:hypothetical protein